MKCMVCRNDQWKPLPVPTMGRAITTSGVLISESLEREQCMSCGIMRKARGDFLGNTNFYEEQYENYYDRPGVQIYDRARYLAMAEWMENALGGFKPASILDVGCGAGWSMLATSGRYGAAEIEGVEPSTANARQAVDAGLKVSVERLAPATPDAKKYDLVYANNVFQHVVAPDEFLNHLKSYLAPSGRIVLLLPDADEPSNEMLWFDHNYAFRRSDLARLAEAAGLKVVAWQTNPPDNNLLDKQMVVFAHEGALAANAETVDVSSVKYELKELFSRRQSYLSSWAALDGVLMERIGGAGRVFNFGASMWTWSLAGYCPKYWGRVDKCLVDGQDGICVGKQVVDPASVGFEANDCIVLGVNPANQSSFEHKLRDQGVRVVVWSDIVSL